MFLIFSLFSFLKDIQLHKYMHYWAYNIYSLELYIRVTVLHPTGINLNKSETVYSKLKGV